MNRCAKDCLIIGEGWNRELGLRAEKWTVWVQK